MYGFLYNKKNINHTIIDKLIANQEIKNILLEQIKEKPICETEIANQFLIRHVMPDQSC